MQGFPFVWQREVLKLTRGPCVWGGPRYLLQVLENLANDPWLLDHMTSYVLQLRKCTAGRAPVAHICYPSR
jgi:hypothetical protein